MQNSTAMLARHEALLRHRHWLSVNSQDNDLGSLSVRPLAFHADLATFLPQPAEYSLLPTVPDDADLLVLFLPKSGEKLNMLLAAMAAQVSVPTELWLIGPAKGGIKGGVTRLKQFARDVSVIDSARHCKLVQAWLEPAATFDLADYARHYQVNQRDIVSYPGVFSYGRLDEGTALLMAQLADTSVQGQRVLDMGAGAGVLTVALLDHGASVTAVDASYAAVCATRQTLSQNGLQAQVVHSDLYDQLNDSFDQIWTNPPFHQGTEKSTDVTLRLIEQAPQFLKPGGALTLVANHGLGYQAALQAHFAHVVILNQTARYQVWRAW